MLTGKGPSLLKGFLLYVSQWRGKKWHFCATFQLPMLYCLPHLKHLQPLPTCRVTWVEKVIFYPVAVEITLLIFTWLYLSVLSRMILVWPDLPLSAVTSPQRVMGEIFVKINSIFCSWQNALEAHVTLRRNMTPSLLCSRSVTQSVVNKLLLISKKKNPINSEMLAKFRKSACSVLQGGVTIIFLGLVDFGRVE